MSTEKKITQPKSTASDVAHTVARAGLSAIPLVGGPAAELFSVLIAPPLTKRRDQWMQSIADDLSALEEKVEGFTIDSLQHNEAFITAVMHATQAAIRNHQNEKLEALRNAVLNVASGNAPDEDLQLMFLDWIDTFTPWHLRVLRFLQDPKAYGKDKGVTYPNFSQGSPAAILEVTFPELQGQRPFYDQIFRDLFTRSLVSIDSLHLSMSEHGMFAKRTTEMGDRFIAFISSPLK